MTRRKTGPTKTVADLVHGRSQGLCEHCGELPGEQLHHRLPRRMGGSRRPWINLPSNLVDLNSKCHLWAESNRREAQDLGLLLTDRMIPCRVMVQRWDGLHWLDDEGGFEPPTPICPLGCAVWTSNEKCDCAEETA